MPSDDRARPHLATLVDDFRRLGDATAIVVYRGNRRSASTYTDLADLASRFASELARRQISSGDRVILWGQNCSEWIGAFFGCIFRGVLVVPLDAAGTLSFAERVIADTQARWIVGDRALLGQLSAQIQTLSFEDFETMLPPLTSRLELPAAQLSLDTPLQILFTSGTTAEPKGIVHTHRNVLASLAPIEREMQKYLRYERLVHPLRFLHTLPLSHVFGQFMGLWIPPLLGAEVHFEARLQPARMMQTIRRERISVLAAVPRILELLKSHLEAEVPAINASIQAAHEESIWRRWWRFRKTHREFGFKFWAFVCGGASLPAELESFWRTLGFVVVQGYGMTETSALITLNHPFRTGQGTIGKPLPGRDIRISDDGEIQVRGEMVSATTWQGGELRRREDPWLATGDLVAQDESGQLRFLGRKSEVIVTSAGLNVHPEDVEASLKRQPGVEESVVFPFVTQSGTEPAAVLLFRGTPSHAQAAVIAANADLAEYQRVRRWAVWPDLDLPRTSTGKIQRRKVAQWFAEQQASVATGDNGASQSNPLLRAIAAITGISSGDVSDNARLEEDLHIDSLGRVQLQASLEQQLGITVSDDIFASIATLGELRRIIGLAAADHGSSSSSGNRVLDGNASATPPPVSTPSQTRRFIYPRWPWSRPVQLARLAFLELVMRPLVSLLTAPATSVDLESAPDRPVLIIANHVTSYDGALVLYALPGRMRRRVAVAMSGEMLDDWRRARNQGAWWLNLLAPLEYWLVTALFNVFPLPRGAGFRQSFEHIGEALDRGYNVLIFPEGHRSEDGSLQPFRGGIGLLAKESNTAILPVALSGLGAAKQRKESWFRSGRIAVHVGEVIKVNPQLTAEQITELLREAVQSQLRPD
jgi:long-chain acyl-CoA synthetase